MLQPIIYFSYQYLRFVATYIYAPPDSPPCRERRGTPPRSGGRERQLTERIRSALLLDLVVQPLLELLGGLDGDETPHLGMA